MGYNSIFQMPEWQAVGMSVLQTAVLYLVVLIGLKLAGRRMFAELGAQDLVVLLLVADAAGQGLAHNDGGFWASVVSVMTVIALGSVIERVPLLRKLVEGRAITVFSHGRLNRRVMKDCNIELPELDETARKYGLESYKAFERIVMEADGTMTGTVRSQRLHREIN